MESLWTLPIALQIALGSGYLAYLIAYAGFRERHTSTEAVFRAVAFGLVATAVLTWLDARSPIIQVLAVASTIAVGVLWRFRGMAWTRAAMRHTDVSWTDDIPTAWLTITAGRTDARPAQVVVDTTDGRTLMCDDTRVFADAPHGPCVFGLSGDIAFYVTAERRDNGEWIEHSDVLHPTEGASLTYLPVASIKRIDIRYWTKANGRAAEAAQVQGSGGAAGPGV